MTGERLLEIAGPASGREIELDKEPLIGQDLGSRNVLGDDFEISGRHARIRRQGQRS